MSVSFVQEEVVGELIGDDEETLIFEEGEAIPGERCPIFDARAIHSFAEAADIMLVQVHRPEINPRICTERPVYCPGRQATYLVDLRCLPAWNDIFIDGYGSWGRGSGGSAFFIVDKDGELFRVDAQRRNNPDTHFDSKIARVAYKHPATNGKFLKFIYVCYTLEGQEPAWALVSYEWRCEPFKFKLLPHGNCKRDEPYQPTVPSIRKRMRDLSHHVTPAAALNTIINERGGTPKPGDLPRDIKQAQNFSARSTRQKRPYRRRTPGMGMSFDGSFTRGIPGDYLHGLGVVSPYTPTGIKRMRGGGHMPSTSKDMVHDPYGASGVGTSSAVDATKDTVCRPHEDAQFAIATIGFLKDIAGMFGSQCVFFLSQGDKGRVPIMGMPGTNTSVADGDKEWVSAPQHKLITSVYAACRIGDDRQVSDSGATYIACRSFKHDTSTAASHAADFNRLLDLREFEEDVLCPAPATGMKPILVVTVDGGTDENPRFLKTMAAWAAIFVEHNMDAIFVATYAPGQSALNAVERRMAPLSRDLAGLVLDDGSWTHLDQQGDTIDEQLELENFARAGSILANVWSQTSIDNMPVYAEYVPPDAPKPDHELPDEGWVSEHVRQSQYLLQIVRCNNNNCCGQWRTNYLRMVPERFLPSPLPLVRTSEGVKVSEMDDESGEFGSLSEQMLSRDLAPPCEFNQLPFDFYCPSVRKHLVKRICGTCGLYHPTQQALKRHRACHMGAGYQQTSAGEVQEQVGEEVEVDELFDNRDVDAFF